MMGNFNSDQWKWALQNMFDFSKSCDASSKYSDSANKMTEGYQSFLSLVSDMNKVMNEHMTAFAEKQAEIMRRNSDRLACLCKEQTQSVPTQQRMTELAKEATEKNMQDAKELSDICLKAHTCMFDMYSNHWKCFCTKCGCGGAGSEDAKAQWMGGSCGASGKSGKK